MGRTVIVEEKVGEYISSLYGRHDWQSGLIIGQLTSQKDYVVLLAQTPEQNEEIESESSAKAADRWQVEHARQVSRLLTGNFEVIGVYCFGSPEAVSKELPKLRHLLFVIHKATTNKLATFFDGDHLECDRLMLQICSKTKKITCKSLDILDQQSTARPAELKYQSYLSKWNRLEAVLSLKMSASIPKRLGKAALKTRLMHGLNPSLNSIAAALATINGNIVPNDQPLFSGQQGKGSHSKSVATQTFTVDLFTENTDNETAEMREMTGKAHIWGAMSCRACVNPKATVGDAIQALKYDTIRSITSRCDVLCEDILASEESGPQEEEEKEEGPVQVSRWLAPQRVFTRISGTPLELCDYMFPDEKAEDSVERMKELLGVYPGADELECPETFPDPQRVASVVDQVCGGLKTRKANSEEGLELHQGSFGNRVIGAVIALLTAMTAAGVTYLWGEQG